ncbi:MAG: flagellar hook-length control protein FliK [Lachnospiraceae bacterium]|nr:flagellar hook-length control protein FliK [Lachnospiraceae bacterium]
MNLGDIFQALTGGVKPSNTSARTSGAYATGDGNYRAMSEIRNMVPGQTIQGEVVGKDGNTVQIALDSETVLTAKLERDLNIALGQSMSFEIKTNSNSLISLVPLYANMANEATIMRALAAAGLPETMDNMKMVSDMMREGMPIDRDSIAYVNRQLIDYPNADPNAIMQMIRLGMPISAESIEQFGMYKNYEHQILQSAEQIMDEIPQTYMELIAEGKDTEAASFYEQIIKALIGESADVETALPEAGEGATGAEGEVLTKVFTDGLVDDLTNTVNENGDGVKGENPEALQGTAHTVADGAASETASDALNAALKEGGVNNASNDSNAANGAVYEATEGLAGKVNIPDRAWHELGDMIRKLGADPEIAKQISEGKLSAKETLSQINDLIAANSNLIKEGFHESLKDLFGSKSFHNLLQSQMSNSWLIKPEEVADKENVERLYERLKEQTAKISEAFQMVDKADSAGAKSVNNLQNNLDFMNQMNHLFTYVQLPLKMAGNQAHGDLYVYTNKKSLANKDGTVTALLHLDMENLGPMDVYVTMNTAQNKVNTNFTLKDETALDLIAEHIHILNDRLEKRGYSMKADFRLKDEEEPEETNIMEEIIKQSKNISVLSRTSFDMRA